MRTASALTSSIPGARSLFLSWSTRLAMHPVSEASVWFSRLSLTTSVKQSAAIACTVKFLFVSKGTSCWMPPCFENEL